MDTLDQGDTGGEKRRATLRGRAASLTATACQGTSTRHGGCAGEGAR
ncbi:hypothetical protein K4749_03060 [Streptomyces sp. TRM72054]|nr:hypothetical protein [Streptomyces sp. TRM72054]